MDFKYEEINSPIPNAKVERMLLEGEFKGYRVTPLTDYVLHDTSRDATVPIFDEETGEVIEEKLVLGYGTDSSVSATYAFAPIQMLDEAGNTVTAYGDRRFYCKLASEVPQN